MGTEMSKSSNSISFIDLPTVVQREIFKMLKPWDLFKLSRTCTQLNKSIIENTNFPLQFCEISLDENVLSLKAHFPHLNCFDWSFYDIKTKKWQNAKYSNRIHYYKHYETSTYHNDLESSFLFFFENFFSIFWKDEDVICHRFYMHSSRIQIFRKIMSFMGNNRLYCEDLFVINGNSSVIREIFEKLNVKESLRMGNSIKANSMSDVVKVFQFNKRLENIFFHDNAFLDNFFENDANLNGFLKTWLQNEDKSLRKLQIKDSRFFNKNFILEELETVQYDGRFTLQLLHMDGYYYPGDTVIIQRKDGFFAVVTIATLQTDLNLFAFVVVAT